jgi:hypothetical protein
MLTKGYNILASEEPEASSLDSSYLFASPGRKKSIQINFIIEERM